MPSYAEGLARATESATKAVTAEASLSSLPPLASPLPTLYKAFPLYIASAEQYSNLLAANLVPESERSTVKRKWKLVLERAEKVKKRVEELGGQIGKVEAGDEGEEQAVLRRGSGINGVLAETWDRPGESSFSGERFRDTVQPELAKEQEELDPEWIESTRESWHVGLGQERWLVRQGPGADCSVVAGFGVCMEHNRRWGTKLAQDAMWPQSSTGSPRHSDNGKHVVRLLLNGAWRGVVIDVLLPKSKRTQEPLYATSHPISNPKSHGPAWVPLIMKAYFKAHGGYSLRGSNPAPDIYTLTGWVPERIGLQEGFPREREWDRICGAWKRGEVLVTLGSGPKEGLANGLVPYHAYAVLDLREDENGERVLEIYDPGFSKQAAQDAGIEEALGGLTLENGQQARSSGLFTKSWDSTCSDFETLNLNWNPALLPTTTAKHWSWPKPINGGNDLKASGIRYKLDVKAQSTSPSEVWILLSQHLVNKDRSLDDIALHVQEDGLGTAKILSRQMITNLSPYSNAVHVLYRYTLRKPTVSLTILPLRDRGVYRTGFTLQAFASATTSLSLERISSSFPFTSSLQGSLTSRNAGGHSGLPSWIDNPQYKLVVSPPPVSKRNSTEKDTVRITVQGGKDFAWNVRLLWGKGELVTEWDEEDVAVDSGAYAYGVATADLSPVEPGTYTLSVSSFEPRQTGDYTVSAESTLPISLTPIPAEGAGMYARNAIGTWTPQTAAGRPSAGSYDLNQGIDVTLPRECTFMARAIIPTTPSTPIPLNLTLFKRGQGSSLGEQQATSGPYSDNAYGVLLPKTRLEQGVYVLVISPWEKGMGVGEQWQVRAWADGPLELAIVR